MKVLVGCELSGRVRDAFIKCGHDAVSCDIEPSESPGPHIQGDILEVIRRTKKQWDLGIFFPPCTFLCGSGLHWNKRTPGREAETLSAIEFVEALWRADIEKIAIENPIGCLSTRSILGKPKGRNGQIIQPYNFNEDASKATCLWLKNLPPLVKTKYVEPRIVNGKKRWSNQTDSGQNRLAPSATRGKDRAVTYQGIADAMAIQWGGFI